LAVTAFLAMAAAGTRAESELSLSGVTWLAEDIGGGGVVDNVASTLRIDSDGKLSGSGGCNRLMGSAKVEGDTVVFSPPATTRMMCPPAIMDQERKFLDALVKTKRFEIEGSFLRLLGEDGVALVRFIASD
jgi:putative lipoprotein